MIAFRTAHSAVLNTVAITTPALGDLLLVFAYNAASTTIPTLPVGFTNIATQNPGGSANAARVGYRICNGDEVDCGVWTNATSVIALIYRGALGAGLVIGAVTPTAGNSATLTYGALALTVVDGSSWVVGFGGAKAATAGMGGITAVLVQSRTSQATVNGLDTGLPRISYAAETLAVTGSGRWLTFTVELLSLVTAVLPEPLAYAFGSPGSGCSTVYGNVSALRVTGFTIGGVVGNRIVTVFLEATCQVEAATVTLTVPPIVYTGPVANTLAASGTRGAMYQQLIGDGVLPSGVSVA